MFNNSNGSDLSIEFSLLDLHERFQQGELGVAFPEFMENPKTIEIFENDFVSYVQEKANSITDDYILDFIDLIMDNKALWINYQVNIMVSLFKSAVVLWLNGKENLDKIIISLMKPDFLYELVEVMKEMYDSILEGENDLVEIQQEAVPLMNGFAGNVFSEEEGFEDNNISRYFEKIPGLIDNPTDKKLH